MKLNGAGFLKHYLKTMSDLLDLNYRNLPYYCATCGKGYKKKDNLTKHRVVCDLLKVKTCDEDEMELPSAKKMYQMLIELGRKYVDLEKKFAEVSKCSCKKKKTDVLEWLESNVVLTTDLDAFTAGVSVIECEAEMLMENTFCDTLKEVLMRLIVSVDGLPIAAFSEKANTLYEFQRSNGQINGQINEKKEWKEMSREALCKFLNKMHMKIVDAFYSWMNKKKGNMAGDAFETACDKTIIKLMNVDFRMETTFSRARSMVYQVLKREPLN